jgi:PilZ domain
VEYEPARRTPRYPIDIDIELIDVNSNIQIKARTKILSLCGCGVETAKLFPKGTSVRIKLSHHGTEVKALARVVYATQDLGMGIAFTNFDREDERILESWIAELMSISI